LKFPSRMVGHLVELVSNGAISGISGSFESP
jgi:hypothetical protein